MTSQSLPNSAPTVGSILADKYRVEHIVGQGGMGIVVAARHIRLDEPVAIKLMLCDEINTPEGAERFRREARACAKLGNSEHVVRVRDVDTLPNGRPYMVMELLNGQDLDKVLKQNGVFAIHEACAYLIQACRAVGEAHQRGIIHRDLKPQNLFLTKRADGSPCIKVLDFGISKHTLADHAGSIDLTRPSDILGSAYYMAPEQARSSRSVVPQSDIYSLGAVLYKLLTGRAPFSSKSLLDVYEALLLRPPPPPTEIRHDIPRELERIILRCLDKEPTRRFSNTQELIAALAPFTVPGETTRVDDNDSENVTTVPRRRPEQFPNLSGTLPLIQVRGSKPSAHSDEARANQGIPSQTQPLDARSLHAALHEYLPPKAISRPPAPSSPQLPNAAEASMDGPTPRIAMRSATSAGAHSTRAKTPEPESTNSAASNATVYMTSAALVFTQSSSSQAESKPLPLDAFPPAGTKSITQKKLLALAGGAIAVLVVLLVLIFRS